MALLDQVKKSLTSGFQLPQFGQSESLKQLQAATAGREVVGGEGGPQQGSMAEMVAAAAAQQQQKEDVLQGQVAAAGLEQQAKEQEQQFRQKEAMLDEQALNSRQQMLNKTQEILQDFSQRREELDFREDSARVQYAMTSMRMSNDDYLDRLEAEAARSRLDDQTAFEWELTQSIFRDEFEIFKNDLSFRSAMNADERSFKEYIAEIDINQAIQLAAMQTEAAETSAQYQAYGNIASGVVKAGTVAVGSYLEKKQNEEKQETGSSNIGALREMENQPPPALGGFAPVNDIKDENFFRENLSSTGRPRFSTKSNINLSDLD